MTRPTRATGRGFRVGGSAKFCVELSFRGARSGLPLRRSGRTLSLRRRQACLAKHRRILNSSPPPEGTLTEPGAHELRDQLVQKLRIVRFLRTPDYDALFSGDLYWATECVGGIDMNGRPLVTKSSYRVLHTLTNLVRRRSRPNRALVEAPAGEFQALLYQN